MAKLIFYSGKDLDYRRIVNSLILDNEDTACEITLIDLSKLLYYPGSSTILYPFPSTLISFPNVSSIIAPRKKSDLNLFLRPLKLDIHNCIISSLITILRDDLPNLNSRRVSKLYEKLAHDYISVIHFLSNYFGSLDKNCHEVFVPNGRFPGQKAVIDFFYNQKIFFYEKGFAKNTYFCRNYPTQDRELIQLDFLKSNYQSIDLKYLEGLESKINLEKRDSFTQSFRHGALNIKSPYICIFTSSADEFAHLGEQWGRRDNLDQWKVLELILPILSNLYTVVIRQHPNVVNKSRANYLREKDNLKYLQEKFSDLLIIDGNSSINSYALAKNSEAIIVWNSTIGLEASAIGIRVYHLAPTYYDKVSDVCYVDKVGNLHKLLKIDWNVDTTKALKFSSYLLNSNNSIHHQLKGASLFLYKILKFLSYIFYDGGSINIFFKIKSFSDSIRNRNLRNNLTKLKSFFNE